MSLQAVPTRSNALFGLSAVRRPMAGWKEPSVLSPARTILPSIVGLAAAAGAAGLFLVPMMPGALQPVVAPVAVLAGAALAFWPRRKPVLPAPTMPVLFATTGTMGEASAIAEPVEIRPRWNEEDPLAPAPCHRAAAQIAAAELREFPVFTDILVKQLSGVTTLSEEAAGKILAGLMAVDGQIDALMRFIQQSGSNDRVEAVVNDIESQIGGCREQLDGFVEHQKAEAEQVVHQRARLKSEAQGVSAALDGIGSIARQTTMLSINVAIQAARAGEVGKGFMVIGTEIRTLAEEVHTLSQEIHARIDALMQTVMVDFKDRTEVRAQMERDSINNIVETLDSLAENVTSLLTHQRDVLQKVEIENEAIAQPILEMMGSVQFQDITRQQIEQVGLMAGTVDDHMALLAAHLEDPEGPAEFGRLSEKMEDLFAGYVMNSQRDTHRAAQGQDSGVAAAAAIELF